MISGGGLIRLVLIPGAVLFCLCCSPRYARRRAAGTLEPGHGTFAVEAPILGKKYGPSGLGYPEEKGKGRWLFPVGYKEVWNGILEVLLRNYNLELVSTPSGVITTVWDRFYLKNRLCRNKVSVRVSAVNYQTTALTLKNTTEMLQDGGITGHLNQIWLPSDDKGEESRRLIKGLASWLRLPEAEPTGGSGTIR